MRLLNFDINIPKYLTALVVGLAMAGVGFFVINEIQRNAVKDEAINTAESVVAQMLATRSVYTKDVVGKLQSDGVEVDFAPDHLERERVIPLPATMVHLISDEVNKKGLYTIDLISPWAINPVQLPRTDWERESTAALIEDPRSPQSKIEVSRGRTRLLYMASDFASAPACVSCHNAHPESPKRDYDLGDMMGALVVTVPLTEEFSAAQKQSVYIALGNIGVLAVLVILLGLLWRRIG